ncbi:hypothetical protein HJ207_20900 [Vibrio parahaemolyticus]|nr:hypothetical protein [Vibrio parahaemolyticus]MBE3748851.1 hypothetical protein [Vibrio parahaemolyticus]MBE3770099.1 hypothetical protein [Vibrio parahaemolyticus]
MSHDLNTRFYVAKVERSSTLKKISRVLYTQCPADASVVHQSKKSEQGTIPARLSRSVMAIPASNPVRLALIHDFRSDSG